MSNLFVVPTRDEELLGIERGLKNTQKVLGIIILVIELIKQVVIGIRQPLVHICNVKRSCTDKHVHRKSCTNFYKW